MPRAGLTKTNVAIKHKFGVPKPLAICIWSRTMQMFVNWCFWGWNFTSMACIHLNNIWVFLRMGDARKYSHWFYFWEYFWASPSWEIPMHIKWLWDKIWVAPLGCPGGKSASNLLAGRRLLMWTMILHPDLLDQKLRGCFSQIILAKVSADGLVDFWNEWNSQSTPDWTHFWLEP